MSSDEVDKARQASGTGAITVAPLGATGGAGNPKPLFSNQLEPKERPLENLSSGRVRISSPRFTTFEATVGSKFITLVLKRYAMTINKSCD